MKADQYNVLLHTYYGSRIDGCDLSALIQCGDRSFTPNPNEAGSNRNYSLDVMPQEYSTCGVGDFRSPSVELELKNGSHTVDLRYKGFRLEKGKCPSEGLPGFYGTEDDAETLVILLKDAAAQVEIELHYGIFENYDLITRAVRVVNQGTDEIRLCQCASLCLDFLRDDMDLLTFNARHLMERCPDRGPLRPGILSVGSVRGISSHQHNPFVILCDHDADEDKGICYGAMLLYSGNFEAAVECSQFENSRLVMGIHPYHFCWTLEPRQAFTAPEAAMVCSPDGFGQMSCQYHRAVRKHLLRDPYHGRQKPVLVNNWEATYFDFNAEKLLKIAREAAELELDMLVLDDGWFGKRDDDYSGLGDWYVNEKKLGCSLKELADQVNDLGLMFGLWFEPEMISEDSDLYRAHPEWAMVVPGRKPIRGRSQLVLDMSREDVRHYIKERLFAILDSANIQYVKWDMNRSVAAAYSALLPRERQGELRHRYVLGLYEVMEAMLERYPDLLLEGCSGGGGRYDAGMLYYAPQIWCSDNTDAIERLSIQYGTSFGYPMSSVSAHVSVCPNHQNGRVTPFKTRGICAMQGTFGYELDLSKMTEEEKEEAREQIRTFKERYRLFQFGNYYRITSPLENRDFTAWEYADKEGKEACMGIVYTDLHGNPAAQSVKFRGLLPEGKYAMWKDKEPAGTYSGAALMNSGILLPVPVENYDSCQIYICLEE